MEFKITYAPPIVSYMVVSYIQISRHLALNCDYFLTHQREPVIKSPYLKNYFLISQSKHMLCETPTTYALVENAKIFFQVCTLMWRVDYNLHNLSKCGKDSLI